MQSKHDFEMALRLQQQFDTEYRIENPSTDLTYNDKKKKKVNLNSSGPKGLIDPSWELVDPTPNIHILFVQFNEKFFWNKLLAVTVAWSKRMTVCAGICAYQGRCGLCSITLSEPLLKLRPRKDLIETLLHEMIHAYLFITNNDRDRDGHGPNFHKHMYRINNEAGTNISVYHNFHDEVRLYQQHWWRCDGPCQKRPPFFGMVRRSMNRAPGPNDRWWAEHQQNCTGKFIKVREPEKPVKITKKGKPVPGSPKKKPTNLPDIRDFLPVVKTSPNFNNHNKENVHTINDTKPGNSLGTKNKNGTVVLNPKSSKNGSNDSSVASVIPSNSNIKGFSNSEPTTSRNNIEVFSGVGRKLSNSENIPIIKSNPTDAVRNHWADKFNNPIIKQNTPKRKSSNFEIETKKKTRIDEISPTIFCPNCNKKILDSDINSHLDSCLNADVSILSEFSDELSEDSIQLNNDSIKLVECPVCNTMVEEDELNSHLDECLNKPSTSTDKKRCEICEKYILLTEFDSHVQDCLTKCYDNNEEEVLNTTTDSLNVSCLVCNKDIVKEELNLHLEDCMVSVFDKNNIDDDDEDNSNDSSENKNESDDEKNENNDKKYNCPICMSAVNEINMNRHIDECLNTAALQNEDFN